MKSRTVVVIVLISILLSSALAALWLPGHTDVSALDINSPDVGFRTEDPGPFLQWPLPSSVGLTKITRLPNSPWTHNFLGITDCPPYPALIDPGTWTDHKSYPGNRSYILPGVPDSRVKWQNADNGYPFNNAFACYASINSPGGHAGTDISAGNGTNVLAAAWADEINVQIDGAGDYRIRLRHPNVNGSGQTWYSYYVHLSSSRYSVGTHRPSGGIQAGTHIGGVGRYHLHFEVSLGPNYRYSEARNLWGIDKAPWTGCLWTNQSLCPITSIPVPANQNLVINGDFGSGIEPWWRWEVDWAIYSNVLHFKRRADGSGGNIGQVFGYVIPPNSPIEVQLKLGNPSGVTKRPHIFIRPAGSYEGNFACAFTIPPNTPLQTYIVRGRTANVSWPSLAFEVWPDPPDGIPDVSMDDVIVKYKPDLNPAGVECIPPGTPPTATPTTQPTNTPYPTPQPTATFTPQPTPTVVPSKPINLTAQSGNDSIELSWNAATSPDLHEYHIYRAPSGSSDFVETGVVSGTTYFDSSPDLSPNTNYCYYVEAHTYQGTVIVKSNVDCAFFGEIHFVVPDVHAAQGQTAIVPVNILNADGLQIAASDIWLDFDNEMIETVAVSSTSLTTDYTWASSTTDLGDGFSRVRISSIASPPPTLHGDGSLFWITFRVIGNNGESSVLNLREFIQGVGGSTLYTPRDLYHSVPLVLQDGTFHARADHVLGDLNGNGVVEAVDAYIVLAIANGELQATPEQEQAGDVNGNGEIDAADATMILYYAANGHWPPPESVRNQRAVDEEPAMIFLSDVIGSPGEDVQTTLGAVNLSGWAGGELEIVYDPDVVETVLGASLMGIAQDADLEFYDDRAGLLRVSIASDEPISGDGTLLKVRLRLRTDAPTASDASVSLLYLARTRFNDLTGRDFETSALRRTVLAGSAAVYVTHRHKIYLPVVLRSSR